MQRNEALLPLCCPAGLQVSVPALVNPVKHVKPVKQVCRITLGKTAISLTL